MCQLITNVWAWHPPVGVYIAVLAVLAVFLPFGWEKIGREGRYIATILVVLLLALELKSIYQDRNEHQAEFEATLASMQKLMSEAV